MQVELSGWARADVIAALALFVSCLAFLTSGVSALASWLTYRSNVAATEPGARIYFEPFETGSDWWILHTEIYNRSEFPIEILKIAFVWPLSGRFSKYMGGYAGSASGSGPMLYDLPPEVLKSGTIRALNRRDIDEISAVEIGAKHSSKLAPLIVKMPKPTFWRAFTIIEITAAHHLALPRLRKLRAGALYPTLDKVRHRY